MKRLIVGTITVAVLIAIPRITSAQAKTISSEMRVETGVVEAIDASTRKVTHQEAGRHRRDDRCRAGDQALR